MILMVIPSKLNLLKHARPLREIPNNRNIETLVVDRSIEKEFNRSIGRIAGLSVGLEYGDNQNFVVIGLDATGQFLCSYREDNWPHVHQCSTCYGPTPVCQCPFPTHQFSDEFSVCDECRAKQ
jgi:hypothetical protein